MSDTPELEEKNGNEIACLILHLVDIPLLVPTVTVAEMAPMRPLDPVHNMPEWVMGTYDWRHMQVPVIGYEAINGGPRYPMNPQGRVAILNNAGGDKELPFIAIPTQGIPRMARVSESDIKENTEAEKRPFDLMRVKIGAEGMAIPDISALENAFLKVR